MARCAGFKPDGTRCERIVGAGAVYCYSHDESRAGERARNASKAAKSKGGVEVRAVTIKLSRLADDVLEGTVDKATGSVVAQILGVLIRGLEQERKQRELDEVLERIDALELGQARGQEGGKRWGA